MAGNSQPMIQALFCSYPADTHTDWSYIHSETRTYFTPPFCALCLRGTSWYGPRIAHPITMNRARAD
jgi:hypothetical protein